MPIGYSGSSGLLTNVQKEETQETGLMCGERESLWQRFWKLVEEGQK